MMLEIRSTCALDPHQSYIYPSSLTHLSFEVVVFDTLQSSSIAMTIRQLETTDSGGGGSKDRE